MKLRLSILISLTVMISLAFLLDFKSFANATDTQVVLPEVLPEILPEALPLVIPQITSLDTPYYYRAKTIGDQLVKINQLYPEWTYLSVIGYSHDKKPIYSLVMSQNAQLFGQHPEAFYTTRKHYLFEAGLHGREVVNPVVMVALIEMYLRAMEDPSVLPYVPVESLLQSNVLHFIPLSNPDGFDLSKGGLGTMTQPAVKSLTTKLGLRFLSSLKSNAHGVDLNRNFPDEYFDQKSKSWINIWLKKVNQYVSKKPSLAFYQGPTPASEPETQALMAYISRFNFQATVSLHSKGEVIYWRHWMHDGSFNLTNYALAKRISNYTGYKLTSGEPSGASSGYMSDYIANTMQKPVITLETLDSNDSYHSTSAALYKRVLSELRYVPFATMVWGQEQSRGQYHLYVDQRFIRDYHQEATANAYATKLGGVIRVNQQEPTYILDDGITKSDFISVVAAKLLNEPATNPMAYAQSIGLGGMDYTVSTALESPILMQEALMILYQADTIRDQLSQNLIESPLKVIPAPLPNILPESLKLAIENALGQGYIAPVDLMEKQLTTTTYLKILAALK